MTTGKLEGRHLIKIKSTSGHPGHPSADAPVEVRGSSIGALDLL
jgi:hypothetical protein